MQVVCVVIVPDGSPRLTTDHIEAVHNRLDCNTEWRWLSKGEAAEFEIHSPTRSIKDMIDDAKSTLAGLQCDIGIVPVDHRRKHILIADMDSTMIQQECIDELADAIGIKAHVAGITERAMRGEIEFESALRERVGLLKGLHRDRIEEVARQRLTFTPGGKALVHTMRANGAFTALVSGGFSIFTAFVANHLGFQTNQANILNFDGDELDGTVANPILGRDAKRTALRSFMHQQGVSHWEAIAVGDGANDLAMLEEAGTGVAFRAKPAVAAQADVRIDHCDLTALLYLQGYTRDEFAC